MPKLDGKPHHCPLQGRGEGNCRLSRKFAFCTRHQNICVIHSLYFLIKEGCHACHADQQRKRERKEEDSDSNEDSKKDSKKDSKSGSKSDKDKKRKNRRHNKTSSSSGNGKIPGARARIGKRAEYEHNVRMRSTITRVIDRLFAADLPNQLGRDIPSSTVKVS